MLSRHVLVATALAAGLAASGHARATGPNTLTISGRSGHVDFTLGSTLDLDSDPYGKGVQLSGGKRYAGFCLVPFRPDDRQRGIGGTAPCMTKIAAVGNRLTLGTSGPATLPPGRYRGYLFADGPARVVIPLSSRERSTALRTSGPAPRVDLRTKEESGVQPEIGHRRQTAAPGPIGVAWVGWQFRGLSPAVVSHSHLCNVSTGQQCIGPARTGGAGYDVGITGVYGGGEWTTWGALGPDRHPEYTGSRDTFLTNLATEVDVYALAFTLEVDFGAGPPAA